LSSAFSLFVGRPPRATLFPYTTLFRSGGVADLVPRVGAGAVVGVAVRVPQRDGAGRRVEEILYLLGRQGAIVDADLVHAAAHEIDRKSTRLNSSHDQISYAVFCLKKKK